MRNGPYELIVPPPEYPGMRYRGRYAYEHRVNWWRETGLNPDDFPNGVVHHRNDQKRQNDPKNLTLMERGAHSQHHARGVTMIDWKCENCGTTFQQRAGKTPRFCSRRCIGLFGFPKKKLPID